MSDSVDTQQELELHLRYLYRVVESAYRNVEVQLLFGRCYGVCCIALL